MIFQDLHYDTPKVWFTRLLVPWNLLVFRPWRRSHHRRRWRTCVPTSIPGRNIGPVKKTRKTSFESHRTEVTGSECKRQLVVAGSSWLVYDDDDDDDDGFSLILFSLYLEKVWIVWNICIGLHVLSGLGKFDVEIEILINSQCPQAQHPILACRSMFIIYGSRHASTTAQPVEQNTKTQVYLTSWGVELNSPRITQTYPNSLVPNIQSCRTSRETRKDAARHSTCYSQCYLVSLLDLRLEIWQNQVTTTSASDWSWVFP